MNSHAREGWIRSEGLRLRYVEWGDAAAPAIIALHGLRSFAYTWEPVALPLADHVRFIALDQRGRGQSDWDPQRRYHAEHYVRDLEVLAEELGLKRFVMLGHSMGGTNAFVYASQHPQHVAALVIEDMGPGASGSSAGAERIRRELQSTPGHFTSLAEAGAFWRQQRPDISDAALQARVEHSMMTESGGGVVWRHDAEGIAHARLSASPEHLVDLWPHVDALRVPTLLLRGARSDFLSAATAEEVARRNPHIRRVEVDGAGHYVHDDNLPAFQAALNAFLADPALAGWIQGGRA
ncbi:MAG: alpha/beta hydrolase [Burkholderiales bacterium]|jgi:pimeloyl-ACP methyl ester carboxylesterase|nr:alpha/beta hydrolase [Burkholderiales bacterium]